MSAASLSSRSRAASTSTPTGHRLAALAIDFARGPARSVVVSPDAAEREELTALIRQELGRGEAPISAVLTEKSGSKLSAESYAPGDVIRYKTGDAELGIAPGSAATVRKVNARGNLITVDTSAGEQVSYRLHQAKTLAQGSTVYREEQREFAKDERVRFSAPVAAHNIPNRTFGTVSGRSGDGQALNITLDSGKEVHLTPDQAKHIDYGYVVSSPARADRVLFNVQDPAQLNRDSQLHADLTRAKDAVIYTNDVAALTRKPAGKIEPPAVQKSEFSYQPSMIAGEQEINFGIGR